MKRGPVLTALMMSMSLMSGDDDDDNDEGLCVYRNAVRTSTQTRRAVLGYTMNVQ